MFFFLTSPTSFLIYIYILFPLGISVSICHFLSFLTMSSANRKPIKIMSYNCRGLRNPTVSTLLEKCDLILLQETLITKQDLGAINSLSPLFQGLGASPTDASKGIIKGRPQGGVAILWRKIFSQYINEIELDLDWLIGVSIKFPNCAEFYVFNVYMPFQCNANEEKFLEKLGIIFSIVNDLDSPNIDIKIRH